MSFHCPQLFTAYRCPTAALFHCPIAAPASLRITILVFVAFADLQKSNATKLLRERI